MSYTYLQEPGEEYLAESFLDIPQSVLSKLSLTAAKSYCKDNETESCQSSQFGTMLKPLTESRGEGQLMLFAEDFHAKTLARQEKAQALPGSEADSGKKWRGLLVKFNQDLYSSKTVLCSEQEDSMLFSKTLPKWGMMLDGELFPLPIVERHTKGKECGFLPTPTKHNKQEGAYPAEWTRNTRSLATYAGGKINPEWTEWLMAWPHKWTDLQPLEMDKFQSWLQQHGKSFRKE